MSSIINDKHLIRAIQKLLYLTDNNTSYIVYNVMNLPDIMYNLLFCQISYDLNVKLETIHTLFCELTTKYLYINQLAIDESFNTKLPVIETENQMDSKSQISNHKVIVVKRRDQKQQNKQSGKIPLSQFKQQFLQTIKTILMEFDISVSSYGITDKQICQILAKYFQSYDQNMFWDRVQGMITYKTKLQLKEYFQKSFLQCQYEQISEEDKQKITELTRTMSQSKPSEIVDVFFNQIGQQIYFRRKVIMFVHYLKRVCVK
ncbi:Hypothetical_protein [Hexamita inflata]|uniref:Hypothetical_protein n=1 Tax=Hexamita inflata TaxID=28002 RepID=A0AA86RHJ0_9EUKA|nr:Hypothetical protein HINF_LOCUS65645 [Hexamita inflata]